MHIFMFCIFFFFSFDSYHHVFIGPPWLYHLSIDEKPVESNKTNDSQDRIWEIRLDFAFHGQVFNCKTLQCFRLQMKSFRAFQNLQKKKWRLQSTLAQKLQNLEPNFDHAETAVHVQTCWAHQTISGGLEFGMSCGVAFFLQYCKIPRFSICVL